MAHPRFSTPASLALGIGLISLALLPFIPVLPGLGSLLALGLGLLARPPSPARRSWVAAAAVVAGAVGSMLALIQLTAALLSALGVGPG